MANQLVWASNFKIMKTNQMKFTILIATLFATSLSYGQTNFIMQGRITYERRVSQFKINEKEGEEDFWITEMKKVLTKTLSDTYSLDFTPTQSYFKLLKENTDNKYMFGNLKPNETNYVLQDLTTSTTQMLRSVFENDYQLKDSIKKYEWKLTGEVRDIAGFECKKALTTICDSVVVVAFYTDQIPVKAGPENFNGLPGMIMGLAVPRLAATWFATKLELINTPIPTPAIVKGKKVTWSDINNDITKGLKQWGKEGQVIAWLSTL